MGFGDLIACADPPAAEHGDPGTEPATRRGALGVVVTRQRGGQRPVAVAGRDGAQQVLVTVARRHHAHRDRHVRKVGLA